MRVRKLSYTILLAWLVIASILPLIVFAEETSSITPQADAYVYEKYPSNNYGSETSIKVKSQSGSSKIGYILFNLTIPSNSQILDAKLKIYNNVGGTYSAEVCVYRVTESWNENDVTWNSRPALGEEYDCKTINSAGWWVFDITDLVQGWVNGSYENYGLALCSESSSEVQFYSKDYSDPSYHPVLEVTYQEPVTVTETVTVTVTETTTVANTTITETQTVSETITTTQTIYNTVTETVTTTVANTTYYTTIYETISPTYGNQTANYYTDLANQLVPLVMVIGVICTMLSLLLSATKGR